MLARIFPGPEATSIWIGLIKGRKEEIASIRNQEDNPYFLQSLNAAEQELTRSQLANWDASARSWLLTADEAKIQDQKQLMLIFKNLEIPVNNSTNVYQSVVTAWKNAMVALENLILGMPQRVHDGAVLLALSSWHLYPDIVALGESDVAVHFNDPLVADGACLTVGLQSVNEDEAKGVFWSLSLAHLRYYGEPVVSSRSTALEFSRVSFSDLELVVLGSVLGGWHDTREDLLVAARWFIVCWDFMVERYRRLPGNDSTMEISESDQESTEEKMEIKHQIKRFVSCRTGWFELLVRAAKLLTMAKEPDRNEKIRLVRAGQRWGQSLLSQSASRPSAMFGLSNPASVIPLMVRIEERVRLLRSIALKAGLREGMAVIRYCSEYGSWHRWPHFEYASPVHRIRQPDRRKPKSTDMELESHVRWIGFPYCECQSLAPAGHGQGVCGMLCPCSNVGTMCTKKCHGNITGSRNCPYFARDHSEEIIGRIGKRMKKFIEMGEEPFELSKSAFSHHQKPNSPFFFRILFELCSPSRKLPLEKRTNLLPPQYRRHN